VSEYGLMSPSTEVISETSITCTGTDNLRTTKRQNTQTQNNPTQKKSLDNSTTDTLEKSRLRNRTDRESLV